ncbi:MAG: hypothetical protein GYB68_03325 [Chloroflexi bacterium]|nr:hypothetical protein [Chloroflexota bacterium]
MSIDQIRFEDDGIFFSDYPFRGASVHPTGLLLYLDIREIDSTKMPPEIVTYDGEVLFVHPTHTQRLSQAAQAHSIPDVAHYDVWAELLTAFLDTTYDFDAEEETFARLAAVGIDRALSEEIRVYINEPLLWYNKTSTWQHMSHYDALMAINAYTGFRLPDEEMIDLYWWTMDIAAYALV